LEALHEYRILDTLPEDSFDNIVKLAAEVCRVPIALFTLVDENRQWFKSRIGIDLEETPRDVSFCAHAVHQNELLVVEDAGADSRFLDNSLVVDAPKIRFYAGVPIRVSESLPLGTLCVIDTQPRSLTAHEAQILKSLARTLEAQLALRKTLASEAVLREERAVLIQMFHHDAAGMLAALGWNLAVVRKKGVFDAELIDDGLRIVRAIQVLCEGVGHISTGDTTELSTSIENVDLHAWFKTIAKRAQQTAKRAGIEVAARFDLRAAVVATDIHLLERIVTNVYLNAVQACGPGNTITVSVQDEEGERFSINVEDDGPGVLPADAERIFEPFFSARGSGAKAQSRRESAGSGLGLPFCRMAIKALGGTIEFFPRQPNGARFFITLARR
jgi:K+-sensing histidine kinase KdpD